MTRIWALIPLVIAAGCGSDDPAPTAGEKACQDFAAKLKECNLVAGGTCNTNQACSVSCAAKADCTELQHLSMPSGTLLTCVAACSGAGPDDFICKDGTQYVNKTALCNGRFECHDGSDETGCADAGPP